MYLVPSSLCAKMSQGNEAGNEMVSNNISFNVDIPDTPLQFRTNNVSAHTEIWEARKHISTSVRKITAKYNTKKAKIRNARSQLKDLLKNINSIIYGLVKEPYDIVQRENVDEAEDDFDKLISKNCGLLATCCQDICNIDETLSTLVPRKVYRCGVGLKLKKK